VIDSQSLVQKWVSDPKRISKPQPEALKAVGAA